MSMDILPNVTFHEKNDESFKQDRP